MHKFIATLTLVLCYLQSIAQQQVFTREDSLNSNAVKHNTTVLSGYGQASYQRNNNNQTSKVNFDRFVLFVGHQFSSKISFFSETEIEHAKVEGGGSTGEISLEQAYLKFMLNRDDYLLTGLILTRMGITNEDHLPVNYYGTERTMVETMIIPSTWRELGVGYYGKLRDYPLSYTVALVTGLNSEKFGNGKGIRESRFEGQNATGNNLAITGSLRYYTGDVRLQLAVYSGGSAGISPKRADSLGLDSGPFGTPVHMGTLDAIYRKNGFQIKALASYVSIPDAQKINTAYANLAPQAMYGGYFEMGYNLLETFSHKNGQQLALFARYELLDMNSKMYGTDLKDDALRQQHIVIGLNYFPIKNVVAKCDVRFQRTGEQNKNLILNPSPTALPYQQNNSYVNLGIGYAF